jgi:hypothetical protein
LELKRFNGKLGFNSNVFLCDLLFTNMVIITTLAIMRVPNIEPTTIPAKEEAGNADCTICVKDKSKLLLGAKAGIAG